MKNTTQPNAQTILHIVNQSGGGTMRYIESLIHSPVSKYRHFVWYVGKHQHVLYDVATPYYYAFSAQLDACQQRRIILTILHQAKVTHLGIHLHSTFGAALTALEQWADLQLPLTVTFHDHHFLSETPFIDGAVVTDLVHIQRLQQSFMQAEILLPSPYLLHQAQVYFDPNKLHVIPHGVAAPATELEALTNDFVQQLKQRADWNDQQLTVATVGAIGEDKGLPMMKAWLAERGDIQFVCLGYTSEVSADQNRPYASPLHITHGFYHHAEIPALLMAYAVDVIVFFAGIPESFCYALSDINGTVPVLAPDYGALGERVVGEKLGKVYPANITPAALNQLIRQLTQSYTTPHLMPQTIEAMTVQTETYYQQHDPAELLQLSLSTDELSTLLADQLHGENLKWELATLVRQHSFLTENVDALKAQREADITELRNQQSHLESQKDYIDTLCNDVRTEQRENQRLNQLLAQQDVQITAMQNSLSWKITKPLRAIRKLFNRQ